MIRIRTTITGDDLSPRGANKAYKDALDWGWKYHRSRYMHFHFKNVAFSRYQEYQKNKPRKIHSRTQRRKRDSRDGRTRLIREQSKREQDKLREERQRSGKTAREAKLPLVKSGFTRQRILRGQVKQTGSFDARKITYHAPRYIFLNPPGTMNKAEALTAINDAEEQDLVNKVAEQFDKNLSKKKKTKRGGN